MDGRVPVVGLIIQHLLAVLKHGFYRLIRVEKTWLLNVQLFNCSFVLIALLRLFLHLGVSLHLQPKSAP